MTQIQAEVLRRIARETNGLYLPITGTYGPEVRALNDLGLVDYREERQTGTEGSWTDYYAVLTAKGRRATT